MEVSGRKKKGPTRAGTDLLCDPCLIDDEQEHAKSYCVECNEFLCDNCSRAHRKSKMLRSHQLLASDEMPKRKLTSLEERHCPKHANEQIKYHCKVHSQFCCTVCVTLDHGQCGVAYIEDLSTDYNTSKEYQNLLKHIADIKSELAKTMANTGTHSEHVNTCYTQMIEGIKSFRCEINSKLDDMENKLLQEAKQIKRDELTNLDSISKSCESIQVDLNNIKSTLDDLEKYRQNTQLVIFSKKTQNSVKAYTSEIEKLSERNRVRNYTFRRNVQLQQSLLASINFGTLEYKERDGLERENDGDKQSVTLKYKEREEKGRKNEGDKQSVTLKYKERDDQGRKNDGDKQSVTLKYKEREEKGRENNGQIQSDTLQKKEDPRPVKATYLRKVNIHHKQDTELCSLTGSVLLTNDTLALTDWSNNSVKIVDLHSDKVTSYIRLTDKPWDITCMNPSTLIATSATKLTFLKYDGKLSIIKELPMEAGCCGITYGNNKLFVTFTKQPKVNVLDTDGNILQTFKTNSQGQNLFVDPEYITLSNDGHTMYVSDRDQNTVTSLGMDGQVYNIYKHEHLSGPNGITVDGNNSVYVVGWLSDNVHQITSQCRHAQIVLEEKDGLYYSPRTVSYNSNTNTMYINGSTIGCNDMFVFKIK